VSARAEGDSRRGTEREHRLCPGAAPGSESSTQQEERVDLAGEERVRNVVVPTLTAFLPARAEGTRVGFVVAPGRGFHMPRGRAKG
jgi:hypothetical protein